MPVYYDKHKGAWRFQFNRIINGRRTRHSRLLPQAWNRTRAEQYDREESARLYAIGTGIEQPTALIETAVALYLEYRIPQLRDGKRIAGALAQMLSYYEGRDLDDLANVAREYTDNNKTLTAGTVRNHLSYLRAACRFAWKHHALGKNKPGERMHMPRVDNERHVYLTPKELLKLWNAFEDEEARAIFQLALFLGLRWISELWPRSSDDIVRAGKDVWLQVPTTKNGTPRMVPVPQQARRLLKYIPFKLHWRTYYAEFMRARAVAGFPDLHAHDLRHTLGAAIVSDGGSLFEVGQALGHKSALSSRRYSHLYPARLADVLERAAKKMPTGRKRQPAKK